jgi:hypothetical protein
VSLYADRFGALLRKPVSSMTTMTTTASAVASVSKTYATLSTHHGRHRNPISLELADVGRHTEWLPRLLLPLATHFCAEDHSSTPLCKQVRADVALDAPNSASSVGFIPGKRWYKLPERKQY